MTAQAVAKPGKGRPRTDAEAAAVAVMEMRVCDLRMAGETFAAIEEQLQITNADRIYRRAVMQRPAETRDQAFNMELIELASLRERAIPLTQADPSKGIPVRLGIHDRVTRLHGLDHAARVADAQLVIDQGKLALMGAALVQALAILDYVSNEDKARVVKAWGEIAEGLADPDDEG